MLGVSFALWAVPRFAMTYILFGLLDVLRNERKNFELFDRYFFGNGFFTAWLFSPVNLFVDLFCYRNKRVYRLDDFSEECQLEIRDILTVFENKKNQIIQNIDKELGKDKRGMYVYRWFGKQYESEFKELNKPFKYITTIAISVFTENESTTSHFGPLRLTLRLLYNLTSVDGNKAFIECGRTKHYWRDNPMFIFDDTLIHRSVNNEEVRRYCVFIDVMRPSPVPGLLSGILRPLTMASERSRSIFYRRWKMLGGNRM